MQKIYATSGPHALIHNNRVPVIGHISQYGQNFDMSGNTQQITKVTFDFDNNGINDEFFYINGKLCFSSINIIRRKFMREFYKILLEQPNLDIRALIRTTKQFYVNHELGFFS